MKLIPHAFLSLTIFLTALSSAAFNYGEALQKAIYFYECQQQGPLPSWNRASWRGPACVSDGSDVGKDLAGGWCDAGDNVKFNFPAAYTITVLGMAVYEYRDAFQNDGQLTNILNNIRFGADYLVKCHTAPNEFYGQVGSGGSDHSFWGPVESVQAVMTRPSAKIDATHPGSDLAGEAAAALASASLACKPADPAYAASLVGHAKQLYAFADQCRGKYDASITAASGYYNSWSGYQDELVWGAVWLFLATGDSSYLAKAELYYDSLNNEPQSTTHSYKWTIAWDDKSYGCYVLLAMITGKQKYKDDAQRWLDYWTVGVNGQKITYTPGGLAWLDTWGVNRYASNTAFFALVYSDWLAVDSLMARYHDFAVRQINYLLGDNPLNRSYVVGFGNNPPCHEHHRTAEGSYPGDASDTIACMHTLYGALVGGPDGSDNYTDQRSNYTQNEPACDYNAAFTGALARMYKEFGGTPLANFPDKETPMEQLYVLAKVNASGTSFTEIDAVLCNKTNQPARVCRHLSYRYFVDLSEVAAAGIPLSQVTISTNYMQGKARVGPLSVYNGSSSIYYVEVSYEGDSLFPGTQDSYKREAQFRIQLPNNSAAAAWDPSNDWSYKTVGASGQAIKAVNMPIYDNGVQVWGAEPDKPAVNAVLGKAIIKEMSSPRIRLTEGYIALDGIGRQQVSLSLFTSAGRRILSVRNVNNKVSLNDIKSGVYFCVVCDKNKNMIARQSVIVRH